MSLSMSLADQLTFQLHTENDSYEDKVKQTRNDLRKLFTNFEKPSISVSGGKDSLVMLDLCLKEKKDTLVWHWDYGVYMPRFFEQEILDILTNFFELGSDQLIIDRRYSSRESSIIGYKAFFSAIRNHIADYNIDLCLIGLRKEESRTRERRAKQLLEFDRFLKIHNAFPLKDWTWLDIWGYIVTNNIPYPSSYDIMSKTHGWKRSRFVTFFKLL